MTTADKTRKRVAVKRRHRAERPADAAATSNASGETTQSRPAQRKRRPRFVL